MGSLKKSIGLEISNFIHTEKPKCHPGFYDKKGLASISDVFLLWFYIEKGWK